ncbi:hypothetical protein GLOTRDRAFT_140457 [Gloeophyllum trabeum ATCC 11539]|uniref:Uncharacterized protein n=1 Tax=Gloeophyllum trabeum (strain ATCC 11539 / FP-39264 / Madison 617) TaxID=670483 RepID=S7RF66_GLOTA|nr:uncharacterized protein GLOTRDRAFT_140457 [Gloeophyllum trabeum ATCC 11539]EPQ52865.1 hypothetical protein GLOTRDRAFT_140457 [Gloeophyllum trabeum ATCC 11539]
MSKPVLVDRSRQEATPVTKPKHRFAGLWQVENVDVLAKSPPRDRHGSPRSHRRTEDSFHLNFSKCGLALDFPRPPPSPSSSQMKMSRMSTPSLTSCSSEDTSSTELPELPPKLPPKHEGRGKPLPSLEDEVEELSVSGDESFLPSLTDDEDDAFGEEEEAGYDEQDDVDDDSRWYARQLEEMLAMSSPAQPSLSAPRGIHISRFRSHRHSDSVVDPTNPPLARWKRTSN